MRFLKWEGNTAGICDIQSTLGLECLECLKCSNFDRFQSTMSFQKFIQNLNNQLKHPLPGHSAQEKMAPEHRLPHHEWELYYPNARKGGVLILFYPHGETVKTVLIQRPSYEGVHSGQVAFPGGAMEDVDNTLIDTAIREAQEEVGINPQKIEVIGELTQLYIPPSNFLISPVISYTQERPSFVLEEAEVEEIIEVGVHEIMDEEIIQTKNIRVAKDISIEAPYYEIHGRVVWGATAMMISELNEILRKTTL